MAQIGCLLWAIFFIIIGFSMWPKQMTIVMIISAIFGLIDGIIKIKKKKRKRPNFKLDEWDKHF